MLHNYQAFVVTIVPTNWTKGDLLGAELYSEVITRCYVIVIIVMHRPQCYYRAFGYKFSEWTKIQFYKIHFIK